LELEIQKTPQPNANYEEQLKVLLDALNEERQVNLSLRDENYLLKVDNEKLGNYCHEVKIEYGHRA